MSDFVGYATLGVVLGFAVGMWWWVIWGHISDDWDRYPGAKDH